MKKCECGEWDCNEMIPEKSYGRPIRFAKGHHGRGKNNYGWKGGRVLNSHGYYRIKLAGWNNYILEHVMIMEEYLGRKLQKGEIVHHKNGIITDNRIENLELMSRGEHSSHHRTLDLHKRIRDPTTGRFI